MFSKFIVLACISLFVSQAFAAGSVTLKDGKYVSNAQWPMCRSKASYDNNGLKKLYLKVGNDKMVMSCSGNICTSDEPQGNYNYYAVILSNTSFLLKEDRWALQSTYTFTSDFQIL